MGLFNFYKSKGEKSVAPLPEPESKPYEGDLNKTKILAGLIKTPFEKRDDFWKDAFLGNVNDASFACGNPQVIEGPDGFPYFHLEIPKPNQPFQCYVIKHMVTDFLLQKGLGIVINAGIGNPDWVFSYGDILNFHLRNEFYSESVSWDLPKHEVIQEKEKILIGQPSEMLLPLETRLVMRGFLQTFGIHNAKLLLMNRSRPEGNLQELVFNLTPDKFQSEDHYESIMRSIGWFLPRHYSYVSMHETSFKADFLPL
ncbi:hypothetical protein C3K47_15435 [Solitalea longa]|uniref:Uncharacterized protein n=1 Tax=Solitalea longa TaxID=2079460 RepID=A0A2S4ZYM5_9SPHI|nr:hypothetical protein [Solitalea longa]POY35451.1 hypothetical protein C3K47_15435 [Solitalea longa]